MTADAAPPRPILAVVRPLLLAGWAIAAVRLGLDAFAPALSMWFGVYYLMPVVAFVVGRGGAFDGVRWPRFALCMIVTGALVWGVPNLISYGTAQFAGWTHGRFQPNERSAPIGETTSAKLVAATMVGVATAAVGSVWMIVTGTLVAWLPSRRRSAARTA